MATKEPLTGWLAERLEILGLEPVEPQPAPARSVVGVDGTEDSQKAAQWAGDLTDEVHLVYAERRGYGAMGASPAALEGLAESGRFAIELVAKQLEGKATKEHVIDASPAQALVDTAKGSEADMIIVAERSRSVTEEGGLGSVSETLVHHAPFPVLLARRALRTGPIVLALGEDAASREAATWALGLAEATGHELIVLHSAPKDLERLELEGFTDRGPNRRAELVDWPPEQGIRTYLDEHQASLLIVGHGQRHGWLGSTALKLLRSAPVAILAVPPPGGDL